MTDLAGFCAKRSESSVLPLDGAREHDELAADLLAHGCIAGSSAPYAVGVKKGVIYHLARDGRVRANEMLGVLRS